MAQQWAGGAYAPRSRRRVNSATCRPWKRAMASSLALGWRPQLVEAELQSNLH